MRKRDLPRTPSGSVRRVELSLFAWHLNLLDGWAGEQGIGRSEMIRQMIRERQAQARDQRAGDHTR